jgi:hypothetical protein
MSPQLVAKVKRNPREIFSGLNIKVTKTKLVGFINGERRRTLIKCVIDPESHQRRMLCPKRATNGIVPRRKGTPQWVGLLHFWNEWVPKPPAYEHAIK